MSGTHRIQRIVLSTIGLFLTACVPGVWHTLATQPEYRVVEVTIDGPGEIQNGASATYTVNVAFECQHTGVVKVVRELWDDDFPIADPNELLSWRRDEVLCQPPPDRTVDSNELTLRCIDGDVWGTDFTDPDGRAIEPNSGEGSRRMPPQAEIYGRAMGTIGVSQLSGQHAVRCVGPGT